VQAILARVPTPDLVFTSEAYGDELALRLGSRHICVDPMRSRVPVSGTAVRRDPLREWRFLPAPVRAHFARRVAVVGPESTGKTSMCAALAERYRTAWVPEFARAHLDVKGAPFGAEDLPIIARGQCAAEDRLARECDRVLFCDTDLVTTVLYAEHYLGAAPGWLRVAAIERSYALTLLLDVDVPWVPDPQRDLGHLRPQMLARFRAAIERRGAPYVLIRGGWDERLVQACAAVDRLLGEPW
jgi:NadR type nicotinamide-nucleotide adenylyltransferase